MFGDYENVRIDQKYSACVSSLFAIACSMLTFKPAYVSFSLTKCLDTWISYISM